MSGPVVRIALASLGLALGWKASARTPLQLAAYQGPDGAITVQRGGDLVDPYFATLALLVAHRGGLAERPAALAFIAWLLPQQGADGLFARYCGQPGGTWSTCAPADADDALLALWMALLEVESRAAPPPQSWQTSLARSSAALAALRDPASGVYRVAPGDPSALLMDNVEVETALRLMAQARVRRGELAASAALRARADGLRRAMARAFPVGPDGLIRYRRPAEAGEAPRFYPDRVAHLYPWLHGMSTRLWPGRLSYRHWMEAYRDEWLGLAADPFPWGLVALVALGRGDAAAARAWCARARPLRDGPRWNVLEEVAFQRLAASARVEGACSID